MKINGETKFLNVATYRVGKIGKSQKNRFKEIDKRKKVERHNGRWTNIKRNKNTSSHTLMELSDESGSKT
ncbi:bromodomain-containing protein [Gossypium australe]|uniref:Bromodomain-containing protein n=1 Tax=Gossypium australe TaxID=47621 RepID=A0A5B6VZ69_9ROSI|nr:bromodomain-containing protein [Gossypium australe]